MALDPTSFPNLLFLTPVLIKAGRVVRDDLSQNQLKKCEAAAKELKNLVTFITTARRYKMRTAALWMEIFWDEKRRQLSSYIKTECTTVREPITQPSPQPDTTSAFWIPAYQFGRWIEKTDRQLAQGMDATTTQIASAAAFLGLAAAAVYRLRFGDTSLLQRLIPAL